MLRAAVLLRRGLARRYCAGAAPVINVAIVAHVDHGKTTLVDCMLKHCNEQHGDRAMDSLSQERERGITIMSKVTSMSTNGFRYNVVDTPGHADFGGEVERVMGMVDGVVLLVDATEGPMPQTKFVVAKALSAGLDLVAVLNKVDRDSSDCTRVENDLFDLLVDLGATDQQLEFPFLYASAKQGYPSPPGPVERPEQLGFNGYGAHVGCDGTVLDYCRPHWAAHAG